MRRLLLLAVFLSAGLALLFWLSGGPRGPGAGVTEPEVETAFRERVEGPGLERPMNLPVSVDVVEGYSQAAKPEALTFRDPRTGESVLVPVFQRWHFKAKGGTPIQATRAGRQALLLEDVELWTYREPRTLIEARAIEQGVRGAYDDMVKWHVTAPTARVDDLALRSLDEQPGGPETVVQLSGGVQIFDVEKHIEIQGETLEVQPYLDRARGTGHFVVRHEAFELTGNGLELSREESRTRVVIHEDALVDLFGDLPGPDGEPLLDLGSREIRPGSISAEGGAVLVHRAAPSGGREDLTLEMLRLVHAEQEGGRSLDADHVRLTAHMDPQEVTTEDEKEEPRENWDVELFEAMGDVIVIYPGKTEDGHSYVMSASARQLSHEISPTGIATTTLEGNPEITLRGDVPLEGLGRMRGPGLLRATAREQARLGPAPASDVRAGMDPTTYRLLELRGDAKLTFRGSGIDPAQDTLEGEEMTMLFRERSDREMAAIRAQLGDEGGPARIVAVSFAVLGEVRLGGTRMSGMTHRLTATDLDRGTPVFVAEGPDTSFAFHGIRRGERMLGGSEEQPPSGASASGSAVDEESPVWVFQRLTARDDVVITTTLGGPSVGVPTRLEGAELTYDRVSDRARLAGTDAAPARVAVGDEEKSRQKLSARSLQLDRRRGLVEARGRVRGTLLVGSVSTDEPGAGSRVLLPEQRLGTAATFGVATNGRIEIRTQVRSAPWDPRLDTEQIIRIEGDLVAEMTSDTLATDSLRAGWLEVALLRTLEKPRNDPTAPSARMGTGRGRGTRPTRPARKPAAKAAPLVPWALETERLQARFGEHGMESIEASGGVRFSSVEGELGGDAFVYEARNRQASIRGHAHATFGPPDGRSEVRADDLLMTVAEGGPESLEAKGRTLAVLIRRDEVDPRILERFFVWCTNVTMTSTAFLTDDLDQILQQQRVLPNGPWTTPFSLWADRVVVSGTDLLSQRAAVVQKLIASGPSTTLQTGEGAEQTTVWGDRFELDVASSRATLEAGPAGDLKIQRGPSDNERARIDQTRVVIDLKSRRILDWDHMKVILRGAGK